MRKLRKVRNKKSVRFLIISVVCILMVMTIGYAAFSTNITLTARGNLVQTTITVNNLKAKAVSTGDGLYADAAESNRYVYKGANPDNYICLSDLSNNTCPADSLYRIISIETDNTLKVIKNTSIGNNAWDSKTTIIKKTSTENLAGDSGNLTSVNYNYNKKSKKKGNTYEIDNIIFLAQEPGSASNNWTKPAAINTYLNSTWYADSNNGLSSAAKTKIVANHTFYIGVVSNTTNQTIATDVSQEHGTSWQGTVGLINATDYVRASTNSTCTGVNAYYNTSGCYNNSSTHNWLFNSATQWTITALSSDSTSVWYANSDGIVYNSVSNGLRGIRPVFFLCSGTTLKGSGTSSSPYTIHGGSCS